MEWERKGKKRRFPFYLWQALLFREKVALMSLKGRDGERENEREKGKGQREKGRKRKDGEDEGNCLLKDEAVCPVTYRFWENAFLGKPEKMGKE